MTTVIARTITRLVVPIALVTAVALLLQGHNLPGGGFIAAVLTAGAVALVYIVNGLESVRTVLGIDADDAEFGHAPVRWYQTLFAIGLALAVGSGLVPILFGHPFLTQTYAIFEHLPIYGEWEIASAIAFDTGVYLTVVGALLTVLGVVGRE